MTTFVLLFSPGERQRTYGGKDMWKR